MHVTDGEATCVDVGFAGTASEPELTVTLKFETTLADVSPLSDTLFAAWPLLRAAARDAEDGAIALRESAEGLFGKGAHAVILWGMDRANRHVTSSPILRCRAATFKGLAAGAVVPAGGDDDEPAAVSVKVVLTAPARSWDPVLLQDVAAQRGGPCWVDIWEVQAALPGVEPENRTAARRQASLLDAIADAAAKDGYLPLSVWASAASAETRAEAGLDAGGAAPSDALPVLDAPEADPLAAKVADYRSRVGEQGARFLDHLRDVGQAGLDDVAAALGCEVKGAKGAAATCSRWASPCGLGVPFERVPGVSPMAWRWTGWQTG